MKSHITECKNCDKSISKDFEFCPNCGQKTNEELTVSVLFYNTISNYFSFDARLIKGLIPLLFKPGFLAKKFIEGKRLVYLHPAQMYLFVAFVFFFIFSFTVNDWIEEADDFNSEINNKEFTNVKVKDSKFKIDSILQKNIKQQLLLSKDSLNNNEEALKAIDSISKTINNGNIESNFNFDLSKSKLDSLRHSGANETVILKELGMSDDPSFISRGFYKTMLDLNEGRGLGILIKRLADTIPIAMFFLLPLFALLLKLFYFKHSRYTHHLVFSFYLFAFLFTVFSLLLGVSKLNFEISVTFYVLTILSTFIYFYIALLNFYNRNWFTTLLKGSIITFIFFTMIIPLSLIIIGLFAVVNA